MLHVFFQVQAQETLVSGLWRFQHILYELLFSSSVSMLLKMIEDLEGWLTIARQQPML